MKILTFRLPVRKIILCGALLLLCPAALLLRRLCSVYPARTEALYSRMIYPAIARVFSAIFGVFPFSAAEVILCLSILSLLLLVVRAVLHIRHLRPAKLLRFFMALLCIFTTGYFLFTVMWGLNYERQPLYQNLGYDGKGPDKAELIKITQNEADAVNSLAGSVSHNADGSSAYPGGFNKMRVVVNAGYRALADGRGALFHDITAHPKGVMLSSLMSYTSIEGIYIPFTCEPNLDTQYPSWVLPFTVAHECAHLQGFAKEDEANFVAYLADTRSPDLYFQYSAHLMAYTYLSNALYQTDQSKWEQIAVRLDGRANADLRAYDLFIESHRSKMQEISSKVNDSYLKSQGQPGIISYDMFVNLLAQKYRVGK